MPREEVPDLLTETLDEHPTWKYQVMGPTGLGDDLPSRVDFFSKFRYPDEESFYYEFGMEIDEYLEKNNLPGDYFKRQLN